MPASSIGAARRRSSAAPNGVQERSVLDVGRDLFGSRKAVDLEPDVGLRPGLDAPPIRELRDEEQSPAAGNVRRLSPDRRDEPPAPIPHVHAHALRGSFDAEPDAILGGVRTVANGIRDELAHEEARVLSHLR